jgi:hypothetical protein
LTAASNINLTWIRRTRLQGEWMNGGSTPGTYGAETGMPVPLNEETESYDVEIMKVVGGTCPRSYARSAA